MLAALCIKVNITGEDGFDRGSFSILLAAMQIVAPSLVVFQLILQYKPVSNKVNLAVRKFRAQSQGLVNGKFSYDENPMPVHHPIIHHVKRATLNVSQSAKSLIHKKSGGGSREDDIEMTRGGAGGGSGRKVLQHQDTDVTLHGDKNASVLL